MKKLIRTLKQISILFLAITLFGCEEDDTALPTVTAGFTYTLSDVGVATFINTSENADKYTWSFGNQDETTSSLINPVFAYAVGAYTVKLTAASVAGASDTFEDTIMILDNEVPLIALIGDTTINVTLGDTFTDPGATALDEVDGDITANIVVGGDTVDTNVEGTYVITYNVSDAQGNAAEEVERTVIVSFEIPDQGEISEACEGSLLQDFETADNGIFGNFGGGTAVIIDNPYKTVNTSDKVGQMQKFAGELYGGTTMSLSSPVDFSNGEVFTMDVFSQRASALTFKLEGLGIEEVITTAGTGWETMTFDFTGRTTGAAVPAITLIFDNGTNGDALGAPDAWTFLFDNLRLCNNDTGGGSDETVILDFENNLAGVTASEFETGGALIANPVSGGINTSPNVYEASFDGNPWWGGVGFVFADGLDQATTVYKAKFYSTVAPTNVLFQVEVDGTNAPVGEVQEITTANEWVELTFTLANIPGGVNRVLIRPDVGNQDGTKPNTGSLYIDDITKVNDGGGGGTDDCTPPAGELLANGGFETDTCWQFNMDSGTSERSTAEANTGTFSARLVTGAGQVSNIKMEGFAKNVVVAGDVVQVALKYKFTTGLGTGSQVKIEGFTEKTEGADPQNLTIISQSPTLNQWIDFTGTFTVTAGLDASRGLSLLILLEGSGNADGAGEVFIDDVQVTKL